MEPPRVGQRGVDWRIYIHIYPLIYTPLLKDTRVLYVGVVHKVEGNEAQLAKHVKELLASLVVITVQKQL